MFESNTPRPISERKLAANRANAQQSTGPRTPAGKARSSLNGFKHGLTASAFALLATASEAERQVFEGFMAQLYTQYGPRDPAERLLLEQLGIAYLRKLRVYAMERTALVRRAQTAGPEGLTALPADVYTVLEYDAVAERSILRTLRELRRLRLLRPRPPEREATSNPPAFVPADPNAEITEG